MKTVTKNKLSKAKIGLIALAAALVLLIIAYIVISLIIGAIEKENANKLPDIREELGESIYAGQPIAYDRLSEAEILSIVVDNDNGKFDLSRWPDDKGEFWFGYQPIGGEEQMVQYIPPILSAENKYDYEDLYAIENNDGLGRMYMLSYLCSAVGTLYFEARIDLPSGDDPESLAKREAILKEYGFGEGETERVSFAWGTRDEEGNVVEEGIHHVVIGDKALNGFGRYYRVDGRDCIYYTGNSQMDYALMGFHSFIKGSLVAAGLPADGAYGPLLTTDFKHWVNTKHEEGELIIDGANVITSATAIRPIKESATFKPEDYPDGLYRSEKQNVNFNLANLGDDEDFRRVQNILVGKAVGECDDLFITLITEIVNDDDKIILFGDKEELVYTYTINAIESVITADNEYHADGTAVQDGSKISIVYDYKIDGESKNTIPCRAILSLDDALLPSGAREALLASTVGTLATPIEYSVTYDKTNSVTVNESIVVEDIFRVYDSKGAVIDVADDNSYVAVRYYTEIDGIKGELTPMTVSMKELKEGNSKWAPLYDALIGRGAEEGVSITVFKDYTYYEMMRGYSLIEIDRIECFITSELIVSFKYQNGSERDPFYGESAYENTTSGKYKLYGIDNGVCDEILKRLGGLGEVSNEALGLSGKTVAVGLTHEVMEKYNLYDYTVYFEMPRNWRGAEGDETNFEWQYTLGFTLYISREDPITGKRYVGSEMYDLVAEVDSYYFEFLNFEFDELYARERMLLIHAKNLDKFKVEFNMDDVYGEYEFDFDIRTVYVGTYNGKYGIYANPFEGAKEMEKAYAYIKEGEGSMKTGLSELIAEHPEYLVDGAISATTLYNVLMGGGEELFVGGGSIDTVGVSSAYDMFQVMQNTVYVGTLTDEEQAAGLASRRLMRFTMKIEGNNASAFEYVYDFYRLSDRKVMVSLYQVDSAGTVVTSPVNDFYISTSAFKKIVFAYMSFLNGEAIDGEIAYPDEK